MQEYEVEWAECPTSYNPARVLFVEAASEGDARLIARDHIKRKHGVAWFTIHHVRAAKPVPRGRIVGE